MRLDVYVVTDASLSRGRSHVQVASEAIRGGADVIQLREKYASTRDLVEIGRALRALTRSTGTLLIVNDRIDVAMAIDADGVHVGQDDMPCDVARRILGPDKIIGVSTATPAEARRALADGANYLGVGAIYATASKPDAGAATGPGLISEIRQAVDLPVVAIGGINIHNAAEAVLYGADGVAVISAVVGAPDVRQATQSLRSVVEEAKGRRNA
jgi:thiamine-phosphate pyrophosphorylase